MNRQTRTLIVVVVALIAAAAATFGVYQGISRMPARQVQMPTNKAVVASAQMPVGTRLTRESVRVVDWPAQTPLQGGFSRVEDVIDRGLIMPVVENEPLNEFKLAPKAAGAGLPPTIKPGMRAISIKVNEIIGVAGFVVPGTRVDVVTVIQPDSRGSNDDMISRVVLSNVEVLTSGTRYDQEQSRADGKPIKSTVVTLMVSPEDAEKVALAQSQGELMLTLRHPLDVEPTETRGVRKAGLFGGAPVTTAPVTAPVRRRTMAPAPVVPAVQATTMYTVETIRAAKRAQEVVR